MWDVQAIQGLETLQHDMGWKIMLLKKNEWTSQKMVETWLLPFHVPPLGSS